MCRLKAKYWWEDWEEGHADGKHSHDIPRLTFWGKRSIRHKFDETPDCAKRLIFFRSWKAQDIYIYVCVQYSYPSCDQQKRDCPPQASNESTWNKNCQTQTIKTEFERQVKTSSRTGRLLRNQFPADFPDYFVNHHVCRLKKHGGWLNHQLYHHVWFLNDHSWLLNHYFC